MSLACLMSLSLLPSLPPPLSPYVQIAAIPLVVVTSVQSRTTENVSTEIFVPGRPCLPVLPCLLSPQPPSYVLDVVPTVEVVQERKKKDVATNIFVQQYSSLQPNLLSSLPVLHAAQQKPVVQEYALCAFKTSALRPSLAHLVVMILINLANTCKKDSNVVDVIVLHVA